MHEFTYDRPTQIAVALQSITSGGQFLAGGQTLLVALRQRLAQPERLVDLGGIADLQGIREEGGQLVVGAMTRHQVVADSPLVRQRIPALAELAGGIGDRQVRVMGTLGGSVANNDPAADYPAAVLGLGAVVQTNRRRIAADDFFQGLYTTALEAGELIEAIHFPVPERAAYAKFRQPASRFALIGVFVAQTASGVRVAVTGGGNGVCRHTGLEAALARDFSARAVDGVAIDADAFSGDLHASPEYRAHLVTVQARQAVAQAR